MRYKCIELDCQKSFPGSRRTTPFKVMEVVLYPESSTLDASHVAEFVDTANYLASQVYAASANSMPMRDSDTVLANCLAGVVSEYLWMTILISDDGDYMVRPTRYTSASCQIDLEVVANGKRIEVRSSFPRRGAEFAICHPTCEFDVLGPYANKYKPGEVHKDYYLRCLFPLDKPTDIISAIHKDGFSLYLSGGATWSMMWDDAVSCEKDLLPNGADVDVRTHYRVVPFHNAMDCGEIMWSIAKEK